MNNRFRIFSLSALRWLSAGEKPFKAKFISIKEAHLICEMEKSDGY